MQDFKAYINSIYPLSEKAWLDFSACFKPITISKRCTITEYGKVPRDIYFLKEGLVRAYLITEEGREHNKTLFSPPALLGSLAALIQKSPSRLTFEALTDCSFLYADYEAVSRIYDVHSDLNTFSRKMLEQFFIEKENREIELLTLQAKDRYLNLRTSIPNIDQLISQYQIASYIGITPTQLSRIRKELMLA